MMNQVALSTRWATWSWSSIQCFFLPETRTRRFEYVSMRRLASLNNMELRLKPYPDSVRNYSLNFKNQKEERLAKNRPILASRRLVQSMSQVILATRKFVQTLSAFFPHKRPFTQKEPFLRTRESGRLFAPIHRTEDTWQRQSPKWSQEWCVITIKMNDNLTAQCFETQLGRYCWKLVQNMGHEISQKSIGFELFMKEGSSKARIEYCEDFQHSLAYFLAIQGHSGGIPIDPKLMAYVSIP